MKYKKICALLCAGLCAVTSFAGCSGKNEASIKESDETFTFGGFYTPFPGGGDPPYGAQGNTNTVENWQVFKDSGLDTGLPIFDTTDEQVKLSLANAEAAGIKVLVLDYGTPGIYNIIRANPNRTYEEVRAIVEEAGETIRNRIESFAAYSSFAGLHAYDEPSVEYYNAIAACQDWWYDNFPQYEFFLNLFPSYASNAQLYGQSSEGWNYRLYVNRFIETVNPSMISIDNYPLIRNGFKGSVLTNWLFDLETLALASKQYRIPSRMYIQTTQFLSNSIIEYYREVGWQAYSAMAYGLRGLYFFTYWGYLKPDNDTQNLGTGIVTALGEKTPCYYAVQELTREIESFEKLYLNFNWEGVMPIGQSGSGNYKLLTDSMDKVYGIEKADATEDALIGQFSDDQGNYAYMVTNFSSPFDNLSNTVTIKFENCRKVLICKKGRRIIEEFDNNTLTLNLGSGEGFFVIPII